MTWDDAAYLDYLRRLDDPSGGGEAPPDFDWEESERRFFKTAARLETETGLLFQKEDGCDIQDASFFAQLKTRDGELRVLLLFSRYGNMTAGEFSGESPLLEVILRVLEEEGYVWIPNRILRLPYDGPVELPWADKSWGNRYFNYM